MGQAISRLEGQMSQLTNSKSERPEETLPSQPVTKPINSSQAYVAQEDTMNQCNGVHMLRSGKQVDNQMSSPSHRTQLKHLTHSSSTPSTSKDKSAEQVYKPTAPFSNRLRSKNNAQMKKILEIFNQVKINIPLLDAI